MLYNAPNFLLVSQFVGSLTEASVAIGGLVLSDDTAWKVPAVVSIAIGGLVLSDDIVRKVPVVRLPNYTNHYSCRYKQLTTVNIYDVSRISIAIH